MSEALIWDGTRSIDVTAFGPNDYSAVRAARSLSRQARFNGHTSQPFSVLQHLLYCSTLSKNEGHTPEVQLAVLLHDAAEAYLGDIVRPVKRLISGYDELEKAILRVIYDAHGLRDPEHYQDAVNHVDLMALDWEWRHLAQGPSHDFGVTPTQMAPGDDTQSEADKLVSRWLVRVILLENEVKSRKAEDEA